MERISASVLIWFLAAVLCCADASAIQDVTPALTTSPSVESTVAKGLISMSPPLPPTSTHMTLPAERPSTTVQSTDTLASPASDIERQASTRTSLNSSTIPPARANETLPALPELGTNETLPALPELGTNETLPALPELGTNETLPALPELGTNETLPALPELGTNETLPALPELGTNETLPALKTNWTEGNTSMESAATQEPATTLTPSQESEASTGSPEYPPQSATPANVKLGAESPKTSESPEEIPASPTLPTLPPTSPPARETSRPHTPAAPAKLNQVSPPVFDIGDDQSVVSAQSPASTSMEPLVAGLISLFIIALGLVSTLLYLKFQQRRVRPEFRRLQDLPMDDMMEDTPLSLYSY